MSDTMHVDQCPQTAFAQQLGVTHECCHTCTVEHMFGNVFKCHSSGQVHVCDANCQQLVYNDRYSRMCRVSRRIFPAPPSEALPACRKRSCSVEEEDAQPRKQQQMAQGMIFG